jgi:hypothetical protein
VNTNVMLKICDVCNIPRYAYEEVKKQLKKEVQSAREELKMSLLPTPRNISTLKKKINSKLHEYIGEHYHIHTTIEYTLKSGTSRKQKDQLALNKKNSCFVDIEAVQKTIVNFYNIILPSIKINP